MADTLTSTEQMEDRRRQAQLAYGDACVERSHRFAVYLNALLRPIARVDELERLWADYLAARAAVIAADRALAEAIAARESRHEDGDETYAAAI